MISFSSARCCLVLVVAVTAKPGCDTWTDCDACTQASSWIHGCSWCPAGNGGDGQCHDFLSPVNPCPPNRLVHDASKCKEPKPTPPQPQPAPEQSDSTKFVRSMLKKLFEHLKITDVDVDTCVLDVSGVAVQFRDYATDMESKNYGAALIDMSRGISSLGRSAAACHVPEVQQKCNAFAASVRWAKYTPRQILVDASDLRKDLEAFASAIRSDDPSKVSDALGNLLDEWTAVSGGCHDNKECKLFDGILRVVKVTAGNVKPCHAALAPALDKFSAAAADFDKKEYSNSVANVASGLDVVAEATKSDACGLKSFGDAVGNLSPKLKGAVVRVESDKLVHIMVGSADVYSEIFALVADFKREDYAGVGLQLGDLLSKLRASDCGTKMCIVVEGLLGTFQEGFADLSQCSKNLDLVWKDFEIFQRSVSQKKWSDSLKQLGDFFLSLQSALGKCGLSKIASILQDSAKRLHDDSLASEIGNVIQFLATGSDISGDMQKFIVDFTNQQWDDLGGDLGALSDWITNTEHCHSFACRLVEGLLKEADLTLENLKPCEDKLRGAETDFIAGATLWGQGHLRNAVNSWAVGLNDVAQAVGACGLEKQLGFIEQEANVLGLANLTELGVVSQILVHGSDFYEELFGALLNVQDHDYRAAGSKLMQIMKDLSKWTTGHLCAEPVCYVVNGIVQFAGEMATDLKKCAIDLGGAWQNFGDAFKHLSGPRSIFNRFSNSSQNVSQGVYELGVALDFVSKNVNDCHLGELAAILAQLALKLKLPLEFAWIEAFLKILINGVEIEQEVANSCIDFGEHNWAGFGYNLVKLSKTLLKPNVKQIAAPEIVVV